MALFCAPLSPDGSPLLCCALRSAVICAVAVLHVLTQQLPPSPSPSSSSSSSSPPSPPPSISCSEARLQNGLEPYGDGACGGELLPGEMRWKVEV